MSEMQQAGGYEAVKLVDRTGKGGCEFIFDGVRFTLKPGKPEITVPRFVAEFVFRTDQQKFHTTDGQYVCRFGVLEGPDDFVDAVGPEALETAHIDIDDQAVEGWNSGEADPTRGKASIIKIRTQPGDFAHQGGPRSGTFSGKERGSAP